MYEFTDKAIAKLNRTIQHEFSALRRRVFAFDEVNAIHTAVNAAYEAIDREAKSLYIQIASDAFKGITGRDSMLGMLWLENFLHEYDAVTKYVYTHEFDRKRARTFEALVATVKKKDISHEIKQAMYAMSVQVKQCAEEVTDEATLQGYLFTGVKEVQWKSETDGRVCAECRKRDGKIYPIDKVPDKPHIRCRCIIIPAPK